MTVSFWFYGDDTMRFHRKFGQATSGATAIEYALLASLIGLGIVGSLVTTKGSLSSVFGTASTNMSSATSGSAGGAAATPGQAIWGSKGAPQTVVSAWGAVLKPDGTVFGGRLEYEFTYDDGSFVKFTVQRDSDNNITGSSLSIKNPATDPDQTFAYRFDPAGVQTFFQRTTFLAGSQYKTTTGYSYQNAPGTIQNEGACANGSCGSNGAIQPTADFLASAALTAGQVSYFQALAAPLRPTNI